MSLKKQHVSPAALMSTTGSLPPGPIVADDGPPAADEPAPGASDDASASSDVHAVETLAAGYGATAEQVSSLVCAIGPKAIASAAARGTTTKVCDEAYAAADKARAFFLRKPAATVAQLRMGEVVVKVLVTCAAHASAARRDAGERVAAQRSAAPADSVAHGVAFTRARAGSRQLGNALRGVCAGDGAALERVRVAGQPKRSGHLDAGPGRALVSLVALGRALLDDAAYATLRGVGRHRRLARRAGRGGRRGAGEHAGEAGPGAGRRGHQRRAALARAHGDPPAPGVRRLRGGERGRRVDREASAPLPPGHGARWPPGPQARRREVRRDEARRQGPREFRHARRARRARRAAHGLTPPRGVHTPPRAPPLPPSASSRPEQSEGGPCLTSPVRCDARGVGSRRPRPRRYGLTSSPWLWLTASKILGNKP